MISIKTKAVSITLLVCVILGGFSIYYLGDYGWTIFILIPFLIGFLPVYIAGLKKPITKNESIGLGFKTLGIALLGLLIFALEGMICIFMALPILLVLTYIGSLIGFKSHERKWSTPKNTMGFIAFLSILFLSFDEVNTAETLIPVRTEIVVHAPIEKVWENVVTFDTIASPKDWIFDAGISCPTDATIQGKGVGAIRYCNFTTGSFVEPITEWQAPTVLQFDVIEQPIPMNEMNPFWEVHPPHLEGYFVSQKGQFKLSEINDNQTILEGTTWYSLKIMPQFYWEIWTDYIIHKIHKRVLNHIKKESESNTLYKSMVSPAEK